MTLLELQDVHTYYGDSHVIQGLSLTVAAGEAVSILGRNGVGKTTTLRSIMGLTPARRGRIRIGERDTTAWPPHRVVTDARVAYIPAERLIFPGLTVEENLRLAQRPAVEGQRAWELERIYGYFPILRERHRQDGATLSGGEQQMLAIARGLMGNPAILLLDEPSQGLAPIIVKTVVDIVKQLCEESRLTLLLVEQNHRVALTLAERHYLMDIKGKVRSCVSRQECLADENLITAHLCV